MHTDIEDFFSESMFELDDEREGEVPPDDNRNFSGPATLEPGFKVPKMDNKMLINTSSPKLLIKNTRNSSIEGDLPKIGG